MITYEGLTPALSDDRNAADMLSDGYGHIFADNQKRYLYSSHIHYLARTPLSMSLGGLFLKCQIAIWICDPLVALWYGTEP